ncbi:MAG: hypothetical protein N2515_10115, partial [Deltaproteobacteria bacterium]|nr:hypothetical protein [Deltaproteobacteria bacterium]
MKIKAPPPLHFLASFRHPFPKKPKRLRRRGELFLRFAFFFGIGGSFLAVAIPRFLEEVRLSKVAEASEMLEEIHRRAASYFAEAQDPKGRKRCLPPRAGPTPSEIGPQAQKVDFFEKTLPDHETWEALGFNPTRPIRFRLSFIPTQSGCDLHAPEHSYIPVSYTH